MDENKISLAKNDERVQFNLLVNNKINVFSAIPSSNVNKIIIYCHGLGSNKTWATRFYDELLKNNIGLVSFDFPGHGEDKTDFKEFSLSMCLEYLDEVINYVKEKYDVSIYLFGCSYGGFVILNKIIDNDMNIEKVMLMCPAINFCEIMEDKSKISLDYFNENEYMPLYNDIKIYKNAYIEFKNGDKNIKEFNFKNISIIQGILDKTVLYDDIKNFCEKKNLYLKPITNGKHELYGFDKEIVQFLIESINN